LEGGGLLGESVHGPIILQVELRGGMEKATTPASGGCRGCGSGGYGVIRQG
jgi:hypothetical protein